MFADFPPEFDVEHYRAIYSDLQGFDDATLRSHYEDYGRKEGRIASKALPRQNFISLIPHDSRILEIGPFAQPLVTGPGVRYFDILDKIGLYRVAESIGLDTSRIPDIDYVHSLGDLAIVHDDFDFVVSSHAIEHQPDLVRHLQQVERILSPRGLYFIIIPDKRYCFDYFIAESSMADVVEAHVLGRKVHSLRSLIEHRTMMAHNDALRHWHDDHGVKPTTFNIRAILHEYEAAKGSYIDVHAWRLTPESFKVIASNLFTNGFCKLSPIRVYDTPRGGIEFYAILQKQ